MPRPTVVIFFGGTPSNHDLSMESGSWVCRYLPRARYRVAPVRVTTAGQWQVPLGTLPQQGPVDRVLDRLWQAVPAVSPAAGVERLLAHQPRAMMTLLRGHGGDDGALQNLGMTLGVPVLGSSAQTCYETADKQRLLKRLDGIVQTPRTERYRGGAPLDSAVLKARETFRPPFFIKPAAEEGSVGVETIKSMEALPPALAGVQPGQELVLQEDVPGVEVVVTLIGEPSGTVRVLPPVLIQPERAPFYDALAKRRAGRVRMVATAWQEDIRLKRAVEAARAAYDELGCAGWVTFDFKVDAARVTLLEVNCIPTFSAFTPFVHQLASAGTSPAAMLDQQIEQHLDTRYT